MPPPPAWAAYAPPPPYWGHGMHHHHGHAWGYPGAMPPPWAVPATATAPVPAAAVPVEAHHHHGLAGAALNLNDNAFVKGLLIGAGATFLLTNDTVQKNIIAAMVKLWSTMQGGVEEMKERFRDAEAELQAADEEEA